MEPPVAPPPAAPLASPTPAASPNTAGIMILQWLTYAFWGWTVLSLSILTAIVIANFINASNAGGSTPYAIAAVLVLLPISLVCDYFYSRREPAHKTGAATVIMVIHAVIFALFGIGALICAVFGLVQLGTSSNDPKNTYVLLFSSLIIAVIYGATFLRTLNPGSSNWLRRAFTIVMAGTVILMTILGFVGPVAQERLTRDDRLINTNLYSVQSGISNYLSENGKLPSTLDQITVRGDAETLIERKLVEYKPNTKRATSSESTSRLDSGRGITYFYELCVTYAKADSDGDSYTEKLGNEGGYADYLSTSGHPAGRVCYKLKDVSYN